MFGQRNIVSVSFNKTAVVDYSFFAVARTALNQD